MCKQKKPDIRDMEKTKASLDIRILKYVTWITAVLYLAVTGIWRFFPLSRDLRFRQWFTVALPMILLLLLQLLTFVWLCIFSERISGKYRKSFLKNTALWIAGILVLLGMAGGILMCMLRMDSEQENENGTVTIGHSVWLDETRYCLYEKENILVLRYLRESGGPEDTDPSMSLEEYLREARRQPSQYGPEFIPDTESGIEETYRPTEAETRQETAPEEDSAALEMYRRMDDGYLKIYETFLKSDDTEYRKDYDARGNSYIVIFEDETEIRYLMYDREDRPEESAQYVYFQNKKNPDGSWSPSESRILDMYRYDYGSGEVTDLHKTTW